VCFNNCGIYPIFVATSTSPQRILDRDRFIAAPVDYEGIVKMEGTLSRLPKTNFSPLTTSLSISSSAATALALVAAAMLPPAPQPAIAGYSAARKIKKRESKNKLVAA
jgi:hypothetical protein